ncbi:hypothetical protein JF66_11280 [Cryobacterium sp. MLB-32]|uniref:hypothetical protein n=1 Tax=Cryobacterium sp. MLB-32 TaxID=1529318 RepID=UPI0004E7B8C1|nr:hypothetical protein [Cryobacterium sp. MLB-32]KFF59433.1 hypothetical protein JF66_11280 [Cryobacterium sp. MLB-32]
MDASTGASSTAGPRDWLVNDVVGLRDVVSGPGGTLWFVSNNTDGRGSPASGDDRLYQVDLQEGDSPHG